MTTIMLRDTNEMPIVAPPAPKRGEESLCPEPSLGGRVLVAVRWPVGGIRTHILYNYPTLVRHKYQFTFVGPDDGTLKTFADSLGGLEPVECIGVPLRGKRCGLWREIRRQLRTGRYDLLHSHGVTAAIHSSWANTGLNFPHAATLHDVFRPCHFSGLLGVVKRRALTYLLNQVHALLPVSEDVRLNLLEYLPALRKRTSSITTVLNGIEVEEPVSLSDPPDGLRERLNLHGNVRLIGFLGRFMEQKGFLPLAHAVRELNEMDLAVPFHLVAVGSGDYRNEYAAVVCQLGLADQVTILDFTSDVRPILAQLDLLVIPSQWEASSLLAMEAMTAGIPVLGTDCIGLREVLRGTPARSVPVGDVHSLAVGLRAALEAPWTEEAKAFAPLARLRFDNTPSARKFAAVFDRLIGERRSRR